MNQSVDLESTEAQETPEILARTISSDLDKILGVRFNVLDKGFIRVIDYMGNDSAIVQAARVSYGKGTKQVSEDKGLINYLMRNHHTTPFEMCDIKLHVKAPIFVARQWMRHRTGSFNEYSARYSIVNEEFYIPEIDKLGSQSTSNKQGRELNMLNDISKKECLDKINLESSYQYSTYESFLEKGMSRELARLSLTQNYYTEFYWKLNLHNLFHFLRLRIDKHAQYEIRVYAEAISKIVQTWVPYSFAAFENFILKSVSFSSNQIEILKRMIGGEKIDFAESKMGRSEWKDFCDCLEI